MIQTLLQLLHHCEDENTGPEEDAAHLVKETGKN